MNPRTFQLRQTELRNDAAKAFAEGNVFACLSSLNELIGIGDLEADDWFLASQALIKVREFAQALTVSENGLQLRPNCYDLLYSKATALFQLGQVTAAAEIFESVAKLTGHIVPWQSLASIIPGCPSANHERILNVRRAYAELAAANMHSDEAQNGLTLRPADGKIRVGYISAFFHRSNYMKPVWGLLNGHDRHRFEVCLFVDDCDERGMHWFSKETHDNVYFTTSMTNEELKTLIQRQQLDIVVDLNGYSAPHRLPIFTQRLAHHCIAWFNMYATSGVPGMDWIIGDDYVLHSEEEAFYSERIIRLPQSYLSFEVSHRAPDIVPPPSIRDGGFTFGSLVSQYKITPIVLDAWSEILRRTTHSKLLLANRALKSECNRDYLISQFADRNVTASRLILNPPAEHFEYLQYYDQIDIALDAFPWNGGTTTTEAIWQGVPVLTFDGDRWASRTSRTLLMNSHLSEFVAIDKGAFIETAIAWGNDAASPEKLMELRMPMRERLQSSLCKMDQVVSSMEAIYMELNSGLLHQ